MSNDNCVGVCVCMCITQKDRVKGEEEVKDSERPPKTVIWPVPHPAALRSVG